MFFFFLDEVLYKNVFKVPARSRACLIIYLFFLSKLQLKKKTENHTSPKRKLIVNIIDFFVLFIYYEFSSINLFLTKINTGLCEVLKPLYDLLLAEKMILLISVYINSAFNVFDLILIRNEIILCQIYYSIFLTILFFHVN